jgi:hypothetical protein
MINRIYFDIDETLIHTCLTPPKQEHVTLNLGNHGTYYTIIRPSAKRCIEYARSLVGVSNVHILTTATRAYANKVNDLAGWKFNQQDIFTREDLADHTVKSGWGGVAPLAHAYAHPNNVIIDNLPKRENCAKISFIGIDETQNENYLKIPDYYGVEYEEEFFEENVKTFLQSRHYAHADAQVV